MAGTHGSSCQCQHELSEPIAGTEWLNQYIDVPNIIALNEENPGSISNVFRPYLNRLQDPDPACSFIPD